MRIVFSSFVGCWNVYGLHVRIRCSIVFHNFFSRVCLCVLRASSLHIFFTYIISTDPHSTPISVNVYDRRIILFMCGSVQAASIHLKATIQVHRYYNKQYTKFLLTLIRYFCYFFFHGTVLLVANQCILVVSLYSRFLIFSLFNFGFRPKSLLFRRELIIEKCESTINT